MSDRDLAAELAAQGLPPHIEDEAVLARIAAIFYGVICRTSLHATNGRPKTPVVNTDTQETNPDVHSED